MHTAHVDMDRVAQILAALTEWMSLGIGDVHAQGLQGTQPAIAGAGVTAADQDGVDVFVQCSGY